MPRRRLRRQTADMSRFFTQEAPPRLPRVLNAQHAKRPQFVLRSSLLACPMPGTGERLQSIEPIAEESQATGYLGHRQKTNEGSTPHQREKKEQQVRRGRNSRE